MRNVVVMVGCAALLGCGFSSAEVSLGDTLTIGIHHSRAGRTSFEVRTDGGACSAARVSVATDAIDARFERC